MAVALHTKAGGKQQARSVEKAEAIVASMSEPPPSFGLPDELLPFGLPDELLHFELLPFELMPFELLPPFEMQPQLVPSERWKLAVVLPHLPLDLAHVPARELLHQHLFSEFQFEGFCCKLP